MSSPSRMDRIKALPEAERRAWRESLTDDEAISIFHDWNSWARPNQLEPEGNWLTWLILAGRGFGKTRCGAEWICAQTMANPGTRWALVGRTAADVRDTMIEGESGIMNIGDPKDRPVYEPSKRRLTWSNGSRATAYSADEPNLLRGPQHHGAWCDELAAWRYFEAWDQLQFGLRLGKRPRSVVTTTPRPLRVLRNLMKRPSTHVTRGSTYDNAGNLAPAFMERILDKYKDTTLGRQELFAELLDEAPGALWLRATLDECRVQAIPDMRRIVVAVDPAVTSNDESDETGIIAAGEGEDDRYYVLRDLSGRMSPDRWARRAVQLYHDLRADRIVAEVNQGGDLVERIIRGIDDSVAYTSVHASKGKRARAEPVAALYEQGKVSHYRTLNDLEDQLVNYVPGLSAKSPDRLDALVWAITELMESAGPMVAPSLEDTGTSKWAF